MLAISPMLSSAAQDALSLKRVWETIDINSCPHDYNFHMHTVASDGKLTPLELLQQALDIGLKGFAITDHHSVDGYRKVQTHLNKLEQNGQTNQLTLWTGTEITSCLLKVEIHILGYAFNPKHPALQTYLQSCSPSGEDAEAHKVIDSIHQAGGLAVLAHPHRYRRSAQELIPVAAQLGIDGVETYYAYGNPNPWQPTMKKTEEVQKLASQYNLYTTCGTDTHGSSLLQRV
ncbi:PHP domain protein [Hyella patelloides LEGE 07179]|uniref:PHP domain protein n=1 Tax=Hyella patelloides LEGE 07179 TaxID=945734 RepID=A0A563VN59_9CYAN|nr:PHP domain-containing protein [Hyella patelloides]VEP12715.1 PHP domain protein [Hyella patelloides LEGE 07179]